MSVHRYGGWGGASDARVPETMPDPFTVFSGGTQGAVTTSPISTDLWAAAQTVLTNPKRRVTIVAIANMRTGDTAAALSTLIPKLQVSTDGGTTWTSGGGDAVNGGAVAGGNERQMVCRVVILSNVVPTGDIQIRRGGQGSTTTGGIIPEDALVFVFPT